MATPQTPPEIPPRPKSDSTNAHARGASSPAFSIPTSPSRTKLGGVRTPPCSPPQRMERILSASAFPIASTSASSSTTPQPLPRSSLDLPPPHPRELLKLASGAVNARTGSVLSRGYILKSDYRPSAPPSLSQSEGSALGDTAATEGSVGGGVHLRGATNFRMAELGVFGVAQPTELGLRTVLSVLRSQPLVGPDGKGNAKGRECVWFCTREEPVVYIGSQPFVLRDAAHPTRTYSLSDRAENLEEIETRLKNDVLNEGARFGGVILVQEEIGDQIVNTWVATDNVRTIREVWEQIRSEGYNVVYHRVPVSRDQSPEDRYLDTYTAILSTIPTSSSLVFNCGIGVVRTTFAMSAALVVRRRQMIDEGKEDPYKEVLGRKVVGGGDEKLAQVLKDRAEQATRDRSLLRLMNVLQKSLATKGQHPVLSLLSAQPALLENLRTALLGQYDLILSLLSTLDHGSEAKLLVDSIVDHCDALVNLRESVLQHRVRNASLALQDEAESRDHRHKALSALERYFFLIVYAAFVSDSDAGFTKTKFSSWLKARSEIANMISRLRKTGHYYVFSPVSDLSAIAKGDAGQLSASTSLARGRFADVQRNGGEVVGDEWAQQIVRNRSGIILRTGMILKNDQWHASAEGHQPVVRGAINFRRVPNSSLYGLSQPTQDGIERVLATVRRDIADDGHLVWINLREEPILYVNGVPFVLREETVSLRNVKSYAGISSSRLELLEDRLKSDVLAELKAFDGRLLLHTEAEDGSVNPVWEVIEDASCVKTLREIMDDAASKMKAGPSFSFRRIPITAEKSPDFSDVKEIVDIVAQLDPNPKNSAIVVNCQLGRGRSTRAQVIITLVQRWLRAGGHRLPTQSPDIPRSARYSYTVINNLLRTIRWGQEVKNAVDDAITACGEVEDIFDSIEEARQAAEDIKDDEKLKKVKTQKGIQTLRAYYFMILFASFLNESKAETWRELRETSSYESYVNEHPVFKTIERELETAGLGGLLPLERPLAAGNALSDEVADFVAKRSGRILSAFTLLKSDFFAGLQKMSLPERVEGSPNFRRASLLFASDATMMASESSPVVYGSGMPTVDGLRRALEKMGAQSKLIVWTSMREEPVIYVSGGRPHVLRLYDAPLENVITTGVNAETVEAMELALKADLLREAASNGGKILLHDEIQEADGSFTVTAQWEEVNAGEILTPREVFAAMRSEGLQVDYERLPVTDEQAPIPGVFSRIEERVTGALSSSDASVVFNCQMGRGRTTTGMVAATLISNILSSHLGVSDLSASIVEVDLTPKNLAWDGRESDPYLQGEYKLVLQLVGVMQHGKLAKKLADRAIDAMEGVQNLRRAVYDFKLRAEAADVGSKKSTKIFAVALNYLYRYGTLIVFSNYLLEKAAQLDEDDDGVVALPPFKTWLADRREISHILNKRTLE